MWQKSTLLFCIIISLMGGSWIVQANEKVTPSLDDLGWLVGQWEGEAFGGVCEETWTAPSGGSMLGMYKQITNGSVQFYELVTITEDSGRLVLTLKHFNADMTGWEEKDDVVTFEFKELSDRKLMLDGLSYELIGDDSLVIRVEIGSANGSTHVEEIHCRRIAE